MRTFVFLTNQYLPKPGATGMCVHQIAKELAKKGHSTWTVCYDDGDANSEYDGVKIVKIAVPFIVNSGDDDFGIAKKLHRLGTMWSKLIHIRDYPLRSKTLVNRYVKAGEKILVHEETVTIVASYTPLEAVVAAKKLKERFPSKTKIVYYSTDTLSNEAGNAGILPVSYRTACGVKWEKRLFKSFDKIMIMECHKEHYQSNEYNPFYDKYEVVNFPLFSRLSRCKNVIQNDTEKSRLVYAGTLYKKLRNPEYLNYLLIQLSKQCPIEAVYLGGGDCDDIMKKAELESGGVIQYLGMQNHETALAYISFADILLSIGNAESPMAPSKIYEYMSTGKPIIHVYNYEKDPCLEPLKKYGNALLIRENETDVVDSLVSFVRNPKILDFDQVEAKFITSTPQLSAEIIEQV